MNVFHAGCAVHMIQIFLCLVCCKCLNEMLDCNVRPKVPKCLVEDKSMLALLYFGLHATMGWVVQSNFICFHLLDIWGIMGTCLLEHLEKWSNKEDESREPYESAHYACM